MGILIVLPINERNNTKIASIPGIPNSLKARGKPTMNRINKSGTRIRKRKKNEGERWEKINCLIIVLFSIACIISVWFSFFCWPHATA
jgi:hypothetical protein